MSGGLGAGSRREFLQVGSVSGLGLTLGGLFRAESARADAKSFHTFDGTAKSVIHIWLPGGWAQQETFDPKPLAPLEYRGDMGTVDTCLPGVVFNEKLAHTAKIADRITVLDRGKILITGSVDEVRNCEHGRVQDLLNRRFEEEELDPDAYLERLTGGAP